MTEETPVWRVVVEFDVVARRRESVINEAGDVLNELIYRPDVIACSAEVSDEPVEDDLGE